MKEQKAKPKKVIRKVKKSGVVKLKPSLKEPTKKEAYEKHIREATVKSQNKTNTSVFRDIIDAIIDTIKDKLRIK
jgi:hypothetical protein